MLYWVYSVDDCRAIDWQVGTVRSDANALGNEVRLKSSSLVIADLRMCLLQKKPRDVCYTVVLSEYHVRSDLFIHWKPRNEQGLIDPNYCMYVHYLFCMGPWTENRVGQCTISPVTSCNSPWS